LTGNKYFHGHGSKLIFILELSGAARNSTRVQHPSDYILNFTFMDKKVIFTDKAPAPIGPYSQGIQSGNMIFLSGQIALNPESGELFQGSIEAETHQVMRNIQALLSTAGVSFGNVVKTTIFLKDMNDFGQVNQIYGSYFSSDFPARETVQVARLPKDVRVEISVLAIV
jgi:2-iminobutanoate/2-iminopropanoate deaminase